MFQSVFQDPVRYSDLSIKLWRSGKHEIIPYEGQNYFKDYGYKVSSRTQSYILRFFYIDGHTLKYTHSKESTRVKGTLDLRNMLASMTGKTIVLSYSRYYTTIEAVDFESLKRWRKALAPFVIFTDFPRMYSLGRGLGAGAFGCVYQVQHLLTGEVHAAKVTFKKTHNGASSMVSRQEALMLKKLRHPNIVTLHEIHESVDTITLVMECVEGERINKFVRDGMNEGVVKKEELLLQLLDALSYLYEQHMTHRDLKPSNVLVGYNGELKILDFGLAFNGSNPPKNTKTAGTPGFLAPEIFESLDGNEMVGYSTASDVFAAGLIYYEIITGKQPFYNGSLPISECNRRGYIPLDDKDLSQATKIEREIIKKMLEVDHRCRITPHSAYQKLLAAKKIPEEMKTSITTS